MTDDDIKLELYDYLTRIVNTKYADLQPADREDMIQDVYLKTYQRYTNIMTDLPLCRKHRYAYSMTKNHYESLMNKRKKDDILYLNENPSRIRYMLDDSQFCIKNTYQLLNKYANIIPKREQDIIRLYFWKNLTMKDIAKRYCITRERTQQIITKTLWRYRKIAWQIIHQRYPHENRKISIDEWL